MAGILCLVFFLSGASALIFETLWFRLAGLTFGNSVHSTSLVLSSFMGGLALGNALAARYGERLRRPVGTYAIIEVAIGLSGIALVLVFPYFSSLFAPLFRGLMDSPGLLNAVRFAIAFSLMLIPSTAMGATLPILVRALRAKEESFGGALGRLYGWNTLGAVAGALAGEVILFRILGLRGTGWLALSINLFVAAVAWQIRASFQNHLAKIAIDPVPAPAQDKLTPYAKRLLLGSFLAGAVMLALEVVWFRFTLLFVPGRGMNFAVMLAVVLLGIGLGGLVAAAWLRRSKRATEHLPLLAIGSAITVVVTYAAYDLGTFDDLSKVSTSFRGVSWRSLRLMFPTSFFSGILFTVIGDALKKEGGGDIRNAGLLTVSNTSGAMFGAFAAAFVLLPTVGMEMSLLILVAAYGLASLTLLGKQTLSAPRGRVLVVGMAALFVLSLVLFPIGRMDNRYIKIAVDRLGGNPANRRVVAVDEGLAETAILTEESILGEPWEYMLVTNGVSMSGATVKAKRYMKAYVYLPLAFIPKPQKALLISYGVGNTAKALVDSESLQSIHIVDISRSILGLSRYVFTDDENPLKNPRVNVHVEDGRHFLQTTDQRFDLITAEPPPPKNAGIVNLYTREYFALVRECLNDEGMVSYWLPVAQMDIEEAKSVIRAFCDVFDDATLWSGAAHEFMLVGSRGLKTQKSGEAFQRQWADPKVLPQLRNVGLETPGFMGAMFLADTPQLENFLGDTLPLVDNFPERLSNAAIGHDKEWIQEFANPKETRQRFESSEWIQGFWPEELRAEAITCFGFQQIVNHCLVYKVRAKLDPRVVHPILTGTRHRFLVLWANGVTDDMVKIAERVRGTHAKVPQLHYILYADALARRDYKTASAHLKQSVIDKNYFRQNYKILIYVLCLNGEYEAATRAYRQARQQFKGPDGTSFLRWITQRFSIQ